MKPYNNEKLSNQKIKEIMNLTAENDWLEFKAKLKIFNSEGKIEDRARDEFIKDILGLANGNSQTIRRNKYLIIGADNSGFSDNSERILHSVDYRLPTESEISNWLRNACTPAIVGIHCEKVAYKESQIFIITIPPTFNLHETSRELVATGGIFQKHTVFMRQNEHTVTASVRDGITIQQLKFLHRQEVANPSAIWIGIIVGGFVSFIIGNAKINSTNLISPFSNQLLIYIFVGLGIFFGLSIGWIIKQLNEVRYDWRYLPTGKRIILICILCIVAVICYFFSN